MKRTEEDWMWKRQNVTVFSHMSCNTSHTILKVTYVTYEQKDVCGV
jgi:hypothetical protein